MICSGIVIYYSPEISLCLCDEIDIQRKERTTNATISGLTLNLKKDNLPLADESLNIIHLLTDRTVRISQATLDQFILQKKAKELHRNPSFQAEIVEGDKRICNQKQIRSPLFNHINEAPVHLRSQNHYYGYCSGLNETTLFLHRGIAL